MGIFEDDAITTAKGTERGVYFKPGTYLVEIIRCKEGVSFTRKKFFVAEFKIVESDNPERKPGTPVSFMVTFDKYPESSLGDVADFLRNALACKLLKQAGVDLKPDKVNMSKAIANDCINEKNELVGTQVRVFAFDLPKKEKKHEMFTHHRWFKPSEAVSADAKAEGIRAAAVVAENAKTLAAQPTA